MTRAYKHHLAIAALIVVIGLVATLRAPVFASPENIFEILRASSTYFIAACPVAILLMAKEFDFSVGAMFAVGSLAAGGLMSAGIWWPTATLAGIAVGAVAGIGTGLLVTYFNIPSLVASLAIAVVSGGLASAIARGLIPLPEQFVTMGQSSFAGIPLLVWYAAAIGIATHVLLERTAFGYAIRAIGGDASAAAACGIPVRRVKTVAFALSGALAAFAGILYAARTSVAQADVGGYLMTLQVLTAVLVGGVSLAGGVGSITGVALATLLFGVLQNALGVAGFAEVWSDVIVGVVLVLAVGADALRRRWGFVTELESTRPGVSRIELERLIAEPNGLDAARVSVAISDERRRIERGLHDGAQQTLVNAALLVSQANSRLGEAADPEAVRLLEASTDRLQVALADLRNISQAIYPALLTDYGLLRTVEDLARRSAVPTTVTASELPRYAEDVELAAYFVIAEAHTNAMKHAGATAIRIDLREDATGLVVDVCDDGVGGVDENSGSGIRGLRRRAAALGGALTVTSSAAGTRLTATFPGSSS